MTVDSQRQIVTRPVRDVLELKKVLQLVHDSYVRSGYMKPNPAQIRLGVHYALPSTRTFVALEEEEIVATVSLFADSPLGLPLDSLYSDWVGGLRSQRRKVGEVGMLAYHCAGLARRSTALLLMMKLVFHDARQENINDLLITVNPRHVRFYERLLCFEVFGPQMHYSAVANAPAVLMRLKILELAPADVPRDQIRSIFFSPMESLKAPAYHMRKADLGTLFTGMTDIFRSLNRKQIAVIEEQFPGLRISDMMRARRRK